MPTLQNSQPQQPCLRFTESARAIEVAEVRFVIHVQPFDPSIAGHLRRSPHELGSYPATPIFGRNRGIQNERMRAAVPRNVHEPDQLRVIERAKICQTS